MKKIIIFYDNHFQSEVTSLVIKNIAEGLVKLKLKIDALGVEYPSGYGGAVLNAAEGSLSEQLDEAKSMFEDMKSEIDFDRRKAKGLEVIDLIGASSDSLGLIESRTKLIDYIAETINQDSIDQLIQGKETESMKSWILSTSKAIEYKGVEIVKQENIDTLIQEIIDVNIEKIRCCHHFAKEMREVKEILNAKCFGIDVMPDQESSDSSEEDSLELRNKYMCDRIKDIEANSVLVVVGAAHHDIANNLRQNKDFCVQEVLLDLPFDPSKVRFSLQTNVEKQSSESLEKRLENDGVLRITSYNDYRTNSEKLLSKLKIFFGQETEDVTQVRSCIDSERKDYTITEKTYKGDLFCDTLYVSAATVINGNVTANQISIDEEIFGTSSQIQEKRTENSVIFTGDNGESVTIIGSCEYNSIVLD